MFRVYKRAQSYLHFGWETQTWRLLDCPDWDHHCRSFRPVRAPACHVAVICYEQGFKGCRTKTWLAVDHL